MNDKCPKCGTNGRVSDGGHYTCPECGIEWTEEKGLTRSVPEEPLNKPLPR